MEAADLPFQTVRRLHLQSPDERAAPNLSIFGIARADALVVGIAVGGAVLSRQPPKGFDGKAETVEELKVRASRLVPTLHCAEHDSGYAAAWLIYRGLPADHCKPF